VQLERLSLDPEGKVINALRRCRRDGTSAIPFELLDFLAPLAAHAPRPRAHVLTSHVVLAPATKWRELLVSLSPSSADGTHGDERHGPNSCCAHFHRRVDLQAFRRTAGTDSRSSPTA